MSVWKGDSLWARVQSSWSGQTTGMHYGNLFGHFNETISTEITYTCGRSEMCFELSAGPFSVPQCASDLTITTSFRWTRLLGHTNQNSSRNIYVLYLRDIRSLCLLATREVPIPGYLNQRPSTGLSSIPEAHSPSGYAHGHRPITRMMIDRKTIRS